MKITDMKVAVIGNAPVVRITTDEGIDGIGAGQMSKPYQKPMFEFYRDMIIGKDPTDVERVMLGIRRMGSFKPWGAAVSAIEFALWDIAGKAANLPVSVRPTDCGVAVVCCIWNWRSIRKRNANPIRGIRTMPLDSRGRRPARKSGAPSTGFEHRQRRNDSKRRITSRLTMA